MSNSKVGRLQCDGSSSRPSLTSIDVTAADTLSELDTTLRDAGVKPCLAELKEPVKDKLKRFGLFDQIGEGYFASIGAAVDAFQTKS